MLRRQFSYFVVIGIMATLFDFGLYRLLDSHLLLHRDLAKTVSFGCGTIVSYLANRHWTFSQHHHAHQRFWRFILLYTMTLVTNVGINAYALLQLGQWLPSFLGYATAFIIATGTSAILNFIGSKYWVFKPTVQSFPTPLTQGP